MIRPPFMARVAAGMAVTAYEETLKLPSTAVSLPMTTVSQILQTTMRFQQVLTSLAIKGDHLFESLGARPEENPEWAVFDESTPSDTSTGTNGEGSATPGRFALYSTPPPAADEPGPSTAEKPAPDVAAPAPKKRAAKKAAGKSAAAKSTATKTADVPEIVEYLDYDSLTLAQLRARLRSLSAEDLTALLDYETAHAARAPFMTMLSNRVTSVRDK
ncbi:lipid droplet-associated protein [Rhodococcus sp. (in: high G+C Gram-positive bacteria)]|uniref:lipid droplet-associated protein n=1 Tax=Rhodococcus sp. TaxID=1831 RepID=UPI003890849C